MKYLALVLLALLIYKPAAAQHQCSHHASFSKSPVADTIDAIHYAIYLQNIDFQEKTIQAETHIRLRPKMSVTTIPLELKALQVSSVSSDDASITSFFQSGDLLRINLAEVLSETDTATFVIAYGGSPFHESWGGFHFSGGYAFNLGVGFESDPHNLGKAWFPCVDDFKDRATYEVFVTLPNNLTGIGGGLLAEVSDAGNNQQTWHWQLNQPIPTYLASVAVGNYVLYSDTYQGIQSEIPITIYTRPADTAKVAASFTNLHTIMDFFENRFGSYPFDRIGYAGTAIGAMEHVTNIAYPHFAINGNLNYEYLFTHELSHMWFGNSVTCADAGDIWLNEGWATFCQYFFKHDIYSPQVYRQEMNDNHYDILKNAHITDGSYLPLNDIPTAYTYGATAYDKGATVVHTLMNYLGEELFFDAITAYLQEFKYSPASSEDMRDFLTAYTGREMNSFFDNWVFTAGTPHYSIDSVLINPSGSGFEVQLFLRKKHKGVDYVGSNHQFEVGFMQANGEIITDTVQFDGTHGYSLKTLPFEPVFILADPFDRTADATSDADMVLRQTGEYAFQKAGCKLYVDQLTGTAYFRLTHHWVAPDSLKTAVNGLRLSPYRHWEVNYLPQTQAQLRARFFYSDGRNMDGSLLLNPSDSVVMLYRANTADDWHAVEHYREGLWNIGYIYVENLLPGQYSLAVYDTEIVGISKQNHHLPSTEIRAFPNPANDQITLSWNKKSSGIISFTTQSGKLTQQLRFEEQSALRIDVSDWKKGLYLVELQDMNGKGIAWTKIVVL